MGRLDNENDKRGYNSERIFIQKGIKKQLLTYLKAVFIYLVFNIIFRRNRLQKIELHCL